MSKNQSPSTNSSATVVELKPNNEYWSQVALAAYADGEADRLMKTAYFSEMTGIKYHHLSHKNRFDIILAQGEKIGGMRTQMAQMNKGYNNKIKRLTKKIGELEAALSESGRNSVGTAPNEMVKLLAATMREVMKSEFGRASNG